MLTTPIRKIGLSSVILIACAGVGFIAYAALAAGPESPPATAEIAAQARAHAPASQQPALMDGVVARAELDAAIDRVASCAASSGVSVEVREGVAGQPRSLGFSAPNLADAEVSRLKLEACKHEHLEDVQTVFNAQNRPSREQVAAGWQWFGQCMAAQGVSTQARAVSEEQMIAWLTSEDAAVLGANARCVGQHHERFGFWP